MLGTIFSGGFGDLVTIYSNRTVNVGLTQSKHHSHGYCNEGRSQTVLHCGPRMCLQQILENTVGRSQIRFQQQRKDSVDKFSVAFGLFM